MNDSIFTRIIRGEIPAHKIYEDDKTYVFLTIEPIKPGHALVIPKKQVDVLWELDDEDYQAVMVTCKKVANRIQEVLQPVRVGTHVVGLDVPHAHVHIFPFDTAEEFWRKPVHGETAADEDLADMAARLRMEDAA